MADINARIRLDGEAQFRRQINDAKTAVSGLDNQLKLAESQFETTGNKQELMRTKTELLNQKLDAQQHAVTAAKAALQQCANQGLDPASAKVQEWKGKLAQAETQVIEITREIDNNKQGLDRTGRAYESTGRSAESMGGQLHGADEKAEDLSETLRGVDRGISWQNVSDAIGRINEAIDRGIRKAIQLGRAMWSMTEDATVWADDLITRSAQMGIDTQTLQQWDYAARFIDVDVNTIVAARNKLRSSAGSDALTELGVESYDAAGNLRDATDVMWDTMEALSQIENSEEREAKAQELFGKSFMTLLPLIEAGRDTWESVASSAPLVSEDNISKLGTANDAIEDLNANLDATRNNLLAQLAPAMTTIAGKLTEALQALGEYLESEEGQQKLQQFSDAVVNLATNLLTVDWGQAVDVASTALTAVTDALQWIVDNQDVVVRALEVIAGARIWGMISGAATNVGKLANGVRGLLSHSGTSGGTSAPTGSSGAATGVSGTGLGTTFVGKIGHFLSAIPAPVVGTAIGAAMLGAIAHFAAQQNVYSDQVQDPYRYVNDPNREYVAQAYQLMMGGPGSNGENAFNAMTELAQGIGDVADWFDIFRYTDAARGEQNYLVDLLNGVDLEAGDNRELMASIYRVYAAAFGGMDTVAGRNAYLELPRNLQAAIESGWQAEAMRIDADGVADDTWLYTYMSRFFTMHGAAQLGETTEDWRTNAEVMALEFADTLREESNNNAERSAELLAQIVASALDGTQVNMDGRAVGTLVAPTVSEIFARDGVGR